ncbi:hypothetical protein NDU88_003233 [Pleurodeles waltl]|uniref:Uncharacterized protein n=1 Tax=Pleurodeles waltl TaxID=8319 RepID=A0AAV7L199_PLEWA|nr:hypothetical protein NDU88_003233 [Pleurodeles waltl]
MVAYCHKDHFASLLVGVYVPNYDDLQFCNTLHAKLARYRDVPQIWGGNSNWILSPMVNSSRGPSWQPLAIALALAAVAEAGGIIDVWRYCSLQGREYTYYPTFHDIYMSIDYWHISLSLLSRVLDVTLCIVHTHSPVLLVLELDGPHSNSFSWHFPQNSSMDIVFREELAKTIDEYFKSNLGSLKTFATIWEAFKAYICWLTISKHAGLRHSLRDHLAWLEAERVHRETVEQNLLRDSTIR